MAVLLAAALLAGIGACVVDGDTFHLDTCKGKTIKLWGVDAPPRGEKSAGDATVALSRLIDRQNLRCEEKGKAGPAILARCWVGERDVAEVLATQGWVEAAPKATDGYAAAVGQARAEKRGMWAVAQAAPAPANRSAAKTAPVAPAATANPVAAKAAPGKTGASTPPPAARTQTAALPPAGASARPRERHIGEITVFDFDADPYVRLEGPKRELTYEQRLQLTSYVERRSKAQQFTLTIFSTHHDADARAYAQALTDANEKLEIVAAVPPRKQCVKNQDKSTICFVDEGYSITIPDRLLRRNRGKGIRLQLAGGHAAKPMLVNLDAAMVDGQLNASDEVARDLR